MQSAQVLGQCKVPECSGNSQCNAMHFGNAIHFGNEMHFALPEHLHFPSARSLCIARVIVHLQLPERSGTFIALPKCSGTLHCPSSCPSAQAVQSAQWPLCIAQAVGHFLLPKCSGTLHCLSSLPECLGSLSSLPKHLGSPSSLPEQFA